MLYFCYFLIITDKFGRSGRLVNIGEYYFFRPNELTSKNTDSFHLKTPIDHKNLSFVLKREGKEENIEPEIVVGEIKAKESFVLEIFLKIITHYILENYS